MELYLVFYLSLFVLILIEFSLALEQKTFKYARRKYDQDVLLFSAAFMKDYPFQEQQNMSKILGQEEATVSYYENNRTDLNKLDEDDFIIEIIHKVYQSRLYANTFTYDKPSDKLKASDSNLVSAGKCKRDFDYLRQQFKLIRRHQENPMNIKSISGVTPEVLAFFDSYASQEPNLYLGHLNWLGDWRECTLRHIIDEVEPSKVVSIKGRYCVAGIRGKNWVDKIEAKVEELKKADYFKRDFQEFEYRSFQKINLGVCLPRSCDSFLIENKEVVEDLAEMVKHKLNWPFKGYQLVNLFCLPDETSELRKLDLNGIIFAFLLFSWISANVVATLLDYFKLIDLDSVITKQKLAKQSISLRILCAFSTIRNFEQWKRSSIFTGNALGQLNNSNQPTNNLEANNKRTKLFANDLYFLHALKVALLFCVLYGHTTMFTLWLGNSPLESHRSIFMSSLFMASTLNVDWYFVITGFTVAYVMSILKTMHKFSFQKWIYFIFHRYCRLAPVYLLIFWAARTIGHLYSFGPAWDYKTTNSSLKSICSKEPLWIPHTISSNFQSLFNECIAPSWYIGNDFQFAIITPPIMYLLYKSPILTYIGTIVAIFSSCVLLVLKIVNDPKLKPFVMIHPRNDIITLVTWDLDSIYQYPWYRVGPYLAGMLAGHFCFMLRFGHWNSSLFPKGNQTPNNFNKRRAILAWTGLIGAIFTNIAPYLGEITSPDNLDTARRNAARGFMFHTISAFGPMLLAMAFTLGHWSSFRRLIESSIFGYLSNLNYFVYLSQIELITVMMLSSNRVPEMSQAETFRYFITLSILLYLISIPVTLFVSMPVCALERAFVGVYAIKKDLASELSARKGIKSNGAKPELMLNINCDYQ